MCDSSVPLEGPSATGVDFVERTLGDELVSEMRSRSQSDREAFAALHRELRRIAKSKMRYERPDHTLQPTALVNEVFLKFFKSRAPAEWWGDSKHAVRVLGRAMEQILNDHADAHRASKRGGVHKRRVALDENQAREFGDDHVPAATDPGLMVGPEQAENLFAVREALELLRATSPRQAEVVQLYFYCNLTQEEVGAALGVSAETVKLDWKKAKAFVKSCVERSGG